MSSARISRFLLLIIFLLLGVLGWQIYAGSRQERLDSALITAIQKDDLSEVEAALLQGANVNAAVRQKGFRSHWKMLLDRLLGRNHKDQGTPTALLVALGDSNPLQINKEDARVIKILLEHGADTNSADLEGRRPLEMAQAAGDLNIMRMLLDHGANLNLSYSYMSAMTRAALWGQPDQIELLLSRGANINLRDKDGKTPLMYAIENQRKENVRTLIAHHADLEIKDLQGHTALALSELTALNRFKLQKMVGIIVSKKAHRIISTHYTNDWGDVGWQIAVMLEKAGAK